VRRPAVVYLPGHAALWAPFWRYGTVAVSVGGRR
jgi:hypothetical protein